MSRCNLTLEQDKIHWHVEDIAGGLTLHTIGWIVSGSFSIIASAISLYLIIRHATHYSVPAEQRHIIRILLLIPVYSIISTISYIWYWYSLYWEVIRDCYEAFVIASFFALLCQYIAPTLHDQKEFFRSHKPKPWMWPVNWMNSCCCGIFRTPRSGLTWFNVVWFGVYQYIFIEVVCTFISMATEYTSRYCSDSDNPKYAHIWMLSIPSVAITFTMYFLVAFYVELKTELGPHKPFLKLLSIKLVIFFSFWQSIVIDLLVTEKVIQTNKYVSYGDIYVGLNTVLVCIEMTFFAILHIWSFPWKEYTLDNVAHREGFNYPNASLTSKQSPRHYYGFSRAIIDALNPWDAFKGFARGLRWMCVGRRREKKQQDYGMHNYAGSAGNNSLDGMRGMNSYEEPRGKPSYEPEQMKYGDPSRV